MDNIKEDWGSWILPDGDVIPVPYQQHYSHMFRNKIDISKSIAIIYDREITSVDRLFQFGHTDIQNIQNYQIIAQGFIARFDPHSISKDALKKLRKLINDSGSNVFYFANHNMLDFPMHDTCKNLNEAKQFVNMFIRDDEDARHERDKFFCEYNRILDKEGL